MPLYLNINAKARIYPQKNFDSNSKINVQNTKENQNAKAKLKNNVLFLEEDNPAAGVPAAPEPARIAPPLRTTPAAIGDAPKAAPAAQY